MRQLHDWKGSVEIEGATPQQLAFDADRCGRTIARGHPRTGDAAAISAYIGGEKKLARSIGAFSEAYAAQNLDDIRQPPIRGASRRPATRAPDIPVHPIAEISEAKVNGAWPIDRCKSGVALHRRAAMIVASEREPEAST